MLDGKALSAAEITKLADLESREVLLAKLAGAMKASLSKAVYLFAAPLLAGRSHGRRAAGQGRDAGSGPGRPRRGRGRRVPADAAPAAEATDVAEGGDAS